MSDCRWSARQLGAYLDGEAQRDTAAIATHLETCAACRTTVATWRHAGETLRERIDGAVGETDIVAGIRAVAARIDANRRGSLGTRLLTLWGDVWGMHRRAAAGVAVAMALGALSAPAVVWWLGARMQGSHEGPSVASVVVESLEVSGDATAVVLRDSDSSMTLIWVQAQE
ncbi:MAG: zf-HC2 domain-containing protein, partial [Myxococcota bacterium]